MDKIEIFECEISSVLFCGLSSATKKLTTLVNDWLELNAEKIEVIAIGGITYERFGTGDKICYALPLVYRLKV